MTTGPELAGPKRIQRKRTAGWRMPEGAVYVGRPTKWGNPYKVGANATWFVGLTFPLSTNKPAGPVDGGVVMTCANAQQAVDWYTAYITEVLQLRGNAGYFDELRGKDLTCWCPEGQPCHADVQLKLANGGI